MSTCPGGYLEDFLKWQLDLKVIDTRDANPSLQLAEMVGTSTRVRPVLNKQEFATIVALFEEYRELIEHRLDDFDEDNQSWRDYAQYVDDDVPEALYDRAREIINSIPDTNG